MSYPGLSGHQPRSQGFFPNAEQLIGFLLQSVVLHYEAQRTILSGHESSLSFQTQQEQFSYGRK